MMERILAEVFQQHRHRECKPVQLDHNFALKGGREQLDDLGSTPHKENSEMWRTLVFVTVLAGFTVAAPLEAALKDPSPETRRQEARARQQERIQALSRRSLLSNYQQLEVAANLRGASSATPKAAQGIALELAETNSREAAINLAALGFTGADLTAYRGRDIDLLDVANKVFRAKGTSAEQMLLADNVLVVKAGKRESGRNRLDGFLSAIPFTVVKSLKGSRAVGDVIYVPQESGVAPNGGVVTVTDEINVTPGTTYLLVLSKNWYEQRVAQHKKQTEVGFNALVFLAYQVAENGTLLPSPQPPRTGATPKDVKTIESELKNFSLKNSKHGA